MRSRIAADTGKTTPLGAVLVVLDLKVVAEIIEYLDVTFDRRHLGEIVQPRHAQPEVPLRVGDGQFVARVSVTVFGDIVTRERIAVLAPECAEEIERAGCAPFDGSC
jgi:hypothetical protein